MRVSAQMHKAERIIIDRARDYGLFIVFSGPEHDREYTVKDRATDLILGMYYPYRRYGYLNGKKFESQTVGAALRVFQCACPDHN